MSILKEETPIYSWSTASLTIIVRKKNGKSQDITSLAYIIFLLEGKYKSTRSS
jgi:hypothetical protein